MNNSFLSLVGLIQNSEGLKMLGDYLMNTHQILNQHFSDFEIILVNNDKNVNPGPIIEGLAPEIKQHIFLLQLSGPTVKNNALLAGLDRSNGDYIVIFELELWEQPKLILDLYEQTQRQSDMVYLRNPQKITAPALKLFYKVFYFIMRKYSDLKVDENAIDSRIISRRALNALLKHRENLRYMKALYSMVGYSTSSLDLTTPVKVADTESFSDKFRNSLVAITSYTSFLRTILMWIFLFSLVFLATVVYNAIKVKLSGEDIFGNVGEAVPGWAFLVLLISVFFAVMCLNLYIMSIYLSSIYEEIKQRPSYIIESIKRF